VASTTAVVWFREDLRLHDNEALVRAAAADELLPVYVVDPREFGERPYGGTASFRYEKTGPHRARFLRESVADLRSSLRDRGSDLVVREGRPEAVVPSLAAAVDADSVHWHALPTPEERAVADGVARRLTDDGVETGRYWGHTLHHVDDLPTPVSDIDDTFTPFKRAVEADATVREPFDVPALPARPAVDGGPGELPPVQALGVDPVPADDRGVLPFEGGETRAVERLEAYVWERDRLREYKETRNGLIGADYSSKLSPWLNRGCLSPRRVYEAVQRYEAERVANDSTYWLLFELRWRDFFQFQFRKHGAAFFAPGGIRERDDVDWRDDGAAFDRWVAGETGVPFVDANVRELNATGYVSNRGRQNAASYLANDLRVDWRLGAAYFETQLVDYDPCSNYGNWAYIAGVGNDSRDRSFDVVGQARRYDGDAAYVKRWCPELDPLPPQYAHEPWTMSEAEQREYGVEIGVDYPEPVLDPTASDGGR
jgi:deoxyribodipyrimidine photo-lyase